MRRTAAAAVASALLVVAGCGDDDTEASTAGTTDTTETSVDDTTSTTEDDSAPTPIASAPGELPGERIEIFPYEDAALAVVGVAADDVLNVRAAPDPSASVVAELDPLADGLTATGHNRQVEDGAIWAEIDTGEASGWVNTAYVAQVGATDDVTSRLYPDVSGRPVADTLVHLGEKVAADAAGQGEPQPRIVVVDGPDLGDLGEVTVDVLDYPDDSVLGERLRIFAEQEGGESFRVRTVESTTLCRRGVTEDGACV